MPMRRSLSGIRAVIGGLQLVIKREARGALEGKGQLMIYEPTRREGESRDGYLERFATINQPIWSALTDAE